MRRLLILTTTFLAACLKCGEGTVEQDGACVPKANEGDTGTDTGAGPDTDSGTGSDSGSDTDTGGDVDTGGDTDSGGDSGGDTDADADSDGFTAGGGDCDDTNAAVHPDAQETCGNGLDDDCDGSPGDCAWSGDHRLPEGAWEVSGDRYGDLAGSGLAAGGDVDGDGYGDLIVGAENSDLGGDKSGAVYVVRGPLTGDLSVTSALATLEGDGRNQYLGQVLDFVGDVDGDGRDDFVVGAPTQSEESSGHGPGTAYVVSGASVASGPIADVGVAWTGEMSTSGIGSAVANAGDLNGDGRDDIALGGWEDTTYSSRSGAAYVLFDGTSGGGDVGGADVRIYGKVNGDSSSAEYLGSSVRGIGDVNGDGQDDLAVGAFGWSDPDGVGYYAGAIHVFFGPLSGAMRSSDADAQFVGSATNHAASLGFRPTALPRVGDMDGDGRDDLVVGNYAVWGDTAGYAQYAGAVYMVSGASLTGTVEAFFADWKVQGTESYEYVGWSVTGLGDDDGDGYADVLVGSRHDSTYGYQAGAAYVFRGPLTGEHGVEDADATFYGAGEYWYTGWSLASGDVTGDAFPDLLVGAAGKESGAAYSGSVFALPGGGF